MLRVPRALVLGLPLVELGLLITLGVVAGFGVALLEVVVTGVVGSLLMRTARQGTSAQAGLPMAALMGGGGPRLIAGMLLMVPGLLSDTLGLLLLLPPVRKWVMARAQKTMQKRVAQMMNDPSAFMGGMPNWVVTGAGAPPGWPGAAGGPTDAGAAPTQKAEVIEVTPVDPPALDGQAGPKDSA